MPEGCSGRSRTRRRGEAGGRGGQSRPMRRASGTCPRSSSSVERRRRRDGPLRSASSAPSTKSTRRSWWLPGERLSSYAPSAPPDARASTRGSSTPRSPRVPTSSALRCRLRRRLTRRGSTSRSPRCSTGRREVRWCPGARPQRQGRIRPWGSTSAQTTRMCSSSMMTTSRALGSARRSPSAATRRRRRRSSRAGLWLA